MPKNETKEKTGKRPYTPPTMKRYAPFFAFSPAKMVGFSAGVQPTRESLQLSSGEVWKKTLQTQENG